jgi:hypothetical protein
MKYYYKRKNKKNKKNPYKYGFIVLCVLLMVSCLAVITHSLYKKDKLQTAIKAYYEGDYDTALKIFSGLANVNNTDSQFYLGMIYFYGKGVDVNYDTASRYFMLASERSHQRAMHYLAQCYLKGLGVHRNVDKAIKLEVYAAATEKYFTKVSYRKSTIAGQDFEKNIKLEQQVNRRTTQRTGEADNAEIDSSNKTRAVLESFLDETARGKSAVAYLVGLTSSDIESKPPDIEEREEWFRQSANEGNVNAQTSLGVIYFLGDGVLQDFSEAAYWFEMAAEKGSKEAQFMLGNLYSSGFGVPVDYTKAAALYARAVERNHSLAKCYLAELFSKGYGVRENKDMARYLCQEGFKETGNTVCYDIWDINRLGIRNRNSEILY